MSFRNRFEEAAYSTLLFLQLNDNLLTTQALLVCFEFLLNILGTVPNDTWRRHAHQLFLLQRNLDKIVPKYMHSIADALDLICL